MWSRSNASCGVQGRSPAYLAPNKQAMLAPLRPWRYRALRVVSPIKAKRSFALYAFGVLALCAFPCKKHTFFQKIFKNPKKGGESLLTNRQIGYIIDTIIIYIGKDGKKIRKQTLSES